MTTEFILKFAGVFLGVLGRTVLPWLRKLREGKVERFNKRYLYSAAGSFVIGFIVTLTVFPQFEGGNGAARFEDFFKLFCAAFGFGFGWNALVFEGGQWAGAFKNGGTETGDKPEDSP